MATSNIVSPIAIAIQRAIAVSIDSVIRHNGGSQLWNPASMFTNGEQGAWYDFSDLSAMYQDSAGTIPVTAVEQPLGKVLDKSGNNNHLIQAVAGSRPILSARRNWLTQSDTLNIAPWSGIIRPNIVSLGGGAWRLVDFGLAVGARLAQVVTPAIPLQTYTCSIEVMGEGSDIGKDMQLIAIRNGGTSAVTTTTATLTGSWVKISATVTLLADNTGIELRLASPATNTASAPLVRFPQLEYGANALRYQSITTATSYDTVGFPHYANFDGISHGLASQAVVPLSATNKVVVFVGDANGKVTGTGTIIESSASYLNNAGTFALLVPSLSTSRGSFGSNGGLGGGEKEIQEAPIGQYRSRVITAYNDLSTDGDYGCEYIRTNGIPLAGLVGAGNTDVGTGNFTNQTFFIGSRNNASNFAQVHLHQLVVLGRTPTQADLDNTEGYIFEKQIGA